MSDSIAKAFRWFFIVLFIIGGFAAVAAAHRYGSIKPVILVVLSFGAAYVMSYMWREFRDKLLLFSTAAIIATGLAAKVLPRSLYIYFGYDALVGWDVFAVWALFAGVFGVPFMVYVFNKYGD